jgi:hypothetical protein
MRYRYVLCGTATGSDPISHFRLIAKNNLGDVNSALRVRIPDDLVLTKYSCDSYSTTKDKRTLDDLSYDVMINFNGRWKVCNKLKGVIPCDFHKELAKDGYHVTVHGYLTLEQYKAYIRRRSNEAKLKLQNGRNCF